MHRAWTEINLGAIGHNVRAIRKHAGKDVKICAVVKADAYGHGAVECSKVVLENGADVLGTATCDEAIILRENGIKSDIIVLAHSPSKRFTEIINNNLSQTISSYDAAFSLSLMASEAKKTARVHIKIDTGMGRIGFKPTEGAASEILDIAKLKGIQIDGISSHFAMAETSGCSYTYEQFEKFNFVLNILKLKGYNFDPHICNSGGTLGFPEMHMSMVRPGLLLYGYDPMAPKTDIGLIPAMSVKARIAHISSVNTGESVGYDREFIAKRKTRAGVIIIGYADGYVSTLSNKGRVICNYKYAPVLGRVCMDQMMIDLTDVPEAKLGDEVVLLGQQGELQITANELSELGGIRLREVTCMLGNGKRLPRIYK